MAAPSNVRVGVFGAGAVGCFVGGRLAARGSEVVFVGRPSVAAEVSGGGLVLEDLDGATVRAPGAAIATDPAALADADVVLCCVKSGATAAAAAALAPVLGARAIIVSLQNGVRNAAVLRAALGRPVLAGIVSFNVVAKGGGVFRRATTGPLVLEAGGGDVAAALARDLERAGLAVVRAERIEELQWAKVLYNLVNAIAALSGRTLREVMLSAGYRRVLADLMEEALAVLGAARVRPARLGPVPPAVIARVLRLPTPLFRVVARAQLRIDPEARSSMAEDLRRGRATEIDFIHGEIVRLAGETGARAPRNARVVELVHAAEVEGAPGLAAEELARLLG